MGWRKFSVATETFIPEVSREDHVIFFDWQGGMHKELVLEVQTINSEF
jgi:hypothetical protein